MGDRIYGIEIQRRVLEGGWQSRKYQSQGKFASTGDLEQEKENHKRYIGLRARWGIIEEIEFGGRLAITGEGQREVGNHRKYYIQGEFGNCWGALEPDGENHKGYIRFKAKKGITGDLEFGGREEVGNHGNYQMQGEFGNYWVALEQEGGRKREITRAIGIQRQEITEVEDSAQERFGSIKR